MAYLLKNLVACLHSRHAGVEARGAILVNALRGLKLYQLCGFLVYLGFDSVGLSGAAGAGGVTALG